MSASGPNSANGVPWQRVFDQSVAAMAIMDLQGKYLYVNEAMCRLLGYTHDELIGLNYRDVTHPDDVDEGPLVGEAVLEKRYVRSDGGVIFVLLSRTVVRDSADRPQYFLSQAQDITGRREAELLWQRSFHNAPIGMALLDLKGSWTAVNDTLCRMLGYTREEMLSRSFNDVTYPEDEQQGVTALADLIEGRKDTVSVEKRYRHRDGHPIWMLIRATAVPGADGLPAYLVSQYEDMGEQRLVDAHLAHLALHDPLTGLANRALLADRLDHGLQQLAGGNGVLVVIVADLDQLKPVNDRYGHALGDQMLTVAAQELLGVVRSGDTVARLGGDEFVVVSLLPDQPSAVALHRRVAERLDTRITVSGVSVRLRASVGFATTDNAHTPPETLLHEADRDMYSRKQAHRRSGDEPR
ncbi:diguanylate cyclase with PAS/PAC sensor [Saccharopolyspora erythraea NRRL 2338]|uniref:Histidine kinase/response regulator hybrid protein n=2 Tax=Saccharopolyspora erythraea TaxID=1836 RepID=A4FFA3_SACEN|nr:PAS domain S-box protein [Saccharopolyspora erythraea]EQD81668.1 diguanylate cyclase [Saccharopolyspora erythraea D]PFG96451.1 diguanylate cyclase with PAS/PAC sensor [Saccharopolyspora erythraea NRRL 2338]QRK92946.1 PAS domain S-box protein [Saccharopolyspora erythraea]CAM02728.1 histidine kinase/response regulator hybrid protein [Saccharopolyspora erythraea NRRL 2338]